MVTKKVREKLYVKWSTQLFVLNWNFGHETGPSFRILFPLSNKSLRETELSSFPFTFRENKGQHKKTENLHFPKKQMTMRENLKSSNRSARGQTKGFGSPTVSREPNRGKEKRDIQGFGIDVIAGMTWIKTRVAASADRFSTAQRTARRLPLPLLPWPPLTATAIDVIAAIDFSFDL